MICVILVVGWINWYSDGTFQSSYRETHNGSSIAAASVKLYSDWYHVLADCDITSMIFKCFYLHRFCNTKYKHESLIPCWILFYHEPTKSLYFMRFCFWYCSAWGFMFMPFMPFHNSTGQNNIWNLNWTKFQKDQWKYIFIHDKLAITCQRKASSSWLPVVTTTLQLSAYNGRNSVIDSKLVNLFKPQLPNSQVSTKPIIVDFPRDAAS